MQSVGFGDGRDEKSVARVARRRSRRETREAVRKRMTGGAWENDAKNDAKCCNVNVERFEARSRRTRGSLDKMMNEAGQPGVHFHPIR
jgi:hypothetical protein